MSKVERILLDQNVWRDILRLPERPIILRAFRWGHIILFKWQAKYVGSLPSQDLHFSKVGYSKPIIDAWKNNKIEIVATKVSDSEMSQQQKLNGLDMRLNPLVLDREIDMYMDLLSRQLLPPKVTPSDFYPPWGKKKKDVRKLYIEHYQDKSWQIFKNSLSLQQKDYVDGFIFWQSQKFNIKYIITADLKFIKKAKVWSKHVDCGPSVCEAKDYVDVRNFGGPDNLWTTKQRSWKHQRNLDAGFIKNATGKFWFLKCILRRDLEYVPPKQNGCEATTDQILKALVNMKLGKDYFPPEEFYIK